MFGIRKLLITDKHNVKARFFRGGTTEDMEDNIKSILKREPDDIIIHVGTNNATNLTARHILYKLTIKINNSRCSQILLSFISQPTLSFENGKVALTNHHLFKLLEELNIDISGNRNISHEHLGGKGLNLQGV